MLVKFDPLRFGHAEIEAAILDAVSAADLPPIPEPRVVSIPTLYDGPDLRDVAELHGIRPEQVAELHAAALYTVRFLGFVPGFAYLSGLREQLETPRLASPRRSVPAGSVGIAGNQTGVYPISTPGGWRLIGRTSMPMFRPEHWDPCPLHIGDHVRFEPVKELS